MALTRKRLYEIIFESDTKAGQWFDKAVLGIIAISTFTVILHSYGSIRVKYGNVLNVIEWTITVLFTLEYCLRIWVAPKPIRYILSFYGFIDLLTLLPSYIGLFYAPGQSLVVIRLLRLLRVFRILKLTDYTGAGRTIVMALWKSKEKIIVFIVFVLTMSVIIGTMMYLIEGEESGFTDIPTSVYWAIVTLTTVGYGDLSPLTPLGKFFASLVMILGYSILAVPTGIVTASIISTKKAGSNTQVCSNCMFDKHDDDAHFCKRCGASLDRNPMQEKI